MAVPVLFLLLPLLSLSSMADASLSILCETLVVARGYVCEDHEVVTGDGYILSLQRIPSTVSGGSHPPVLLQHGLLMIREKGKGRNQGAEAWLLNSPAQAAALILADAGFDVWLGNTRGSFWSHGHTSIPPSDRKYWDWTWDNIAEFDLPALLLHVAGVAMESRVFFIGHSQGTLIALAGAMQNPIVARHVAAAALLCPVAHFGHMRSAFAHAASQIFLDKAVRTTGLQEFNLSNKLGHAVVTAVCVRRTVDCSHMLFALTGVNCCLNLTNFREYMPWIESSTSVRNMAHYAQMVRSGQWRKYDYGPLLNVRYYGSLSPPIYDASLIPKDLPIFIAYGGQDSLAAQEDVEQLIRELKGKPRILYLKDYGHIDFILSVSALEDVYQPLLSFFRAYASLDSLKCGTKKMVRAIL